MARKRRRLTKSALAGLGEALSDAFGGRVSVCVPGAGGKIECFPRQYKSSAKKPWTKYNKGAKKRRFVYQHTHKSAKKSAGATKRLTAARKSAFTNAAHKCKGKPIGAFRACMRNELKK